MTPFSEPDALAPARTALEGWLEQAEGPLIVGLCGAQGSGKSTLASALVGDLAARGHAAATLSLDDLYLGRAARADLARRVHPLLATRGVPLTHDVAAGCAILKAVRAGQPTRLPRFDKARDEPHPPARWQAVDGPLALLILEGWCVGARPEHPAALIAPVNALEAQQDADGRWRRAVNAALAGPYQRLFGQLDRLMLLAAPDFSVVERWRTQQEDALRARLQSSGAPGPHGMSAPELHRFIQHYERLTRAILAEMPGRADCTLRLDPSRAVIG